LQCADIAESGQTIALVPHENRLAKVLEREVIALGGDGVLEADAQPRGAEE
jgi:ABC-type histidine transport system ATPase subunit